MKKVIIILTAAIMVACNPTAKLPSIQSGADAAFEQADYTTAYNMYSQYISVAKNNGVDVNNDLYANYAKSCVQLDKIDEASTLYNSLLEDETNIKLIAEYAQMLQANSKIDEELALWNNYAEKISDDNLSTLKSERLVFLNASKENYEGVVEAYNAKGNSSLSKEAQLEYIKALEATKKGTAAAKACNALIKTNPDYTEAIEWKAKYYYNKAENRYKYEMAKYNKNKNATSYAYLRRDLKKVSADFRIARDAFIQLRKKDASNRSYIMHLKNIYIRLDQNAKAAELDKLLK